MENNALEIVIFDLETTIPATDVIEFGCIKVDKRGLFETACYSTLIHSTKCSTRSVKCNGITNDMLRNAPKFEQVAQTIFDLLDGQIWCGYNIISFDNEKLRKEFEKIGRAPPKPSSIVDVYPLLSKTFGKRAGDMKLASLGRYFSLGEEKHRSIDDCRMTLEVFKNCCLQLFLEEHCGLDLAPTTVRPEWSGKSASSSAAVKRQQPQRAKRASSVPLTNADTNEQTTPQTTPKSTPQSTPSKVNSAHALSASVVDALHDALSSSKQIWIAYDGGSNAGVPRQIQPTKWINEPVLIAAVCSVSQSEKYFATRKIVEVRETYWRREVKPLTPLKSPMPSKNNNVNNNNNNDNDDPEQLSEAMKGLNLEDIGEQKNEQSEQNDKQQPQNK